MKIKRIMIKIIAIFALVGTIGIISDNNTEIVNAVKMPPVPKPLRGNWYDGDSKTSTEIPTKITGMFDPGFNKITMTSYMKSIRWEKFGKDKYKIILKGMAPVKKFALRKCTLVNYYSLKRVTYNHQKYRVIIKNIKVKPNRPEWIYMERMGYVALFDRPLPIKTEKAILKKCNLSNKVLKSAIRNAEQSA